MARWRQANYDAAASDAQEDGEAVARVRALCDDHPDTRIHVSAIIAALNDPDHALTPADIAVSEFIAGYNHPGVDGEEFGPLAQF